MASFFSVWCGRHARHRVRLPVFRVHHIVKILPFFANCFITPNAHFLVGGGILIEAANPFLSYKSALELLGEKGGTARATLATWIVWIPVRLVWPTYLVVGMYSKTYPTLGTAPWVLVFTYFTGTGIMVFCFAVFVGALTPEFLQHYGPGKKVDEDVAVNDLESNALIPRNTTSVQA